MVFGLEIIFLNWWWPWSVDSPQHISVRGLLSFLIFTQVPVTYVYATGTGSAYGVNTLRLRQNDHYFPDNIFKCLLLNENIWIAVQISHKFVPEGPIKNIPALAQIMAWHQPGDRPLSKPMLVRLLTHICMTQPQWVKEWCETQIHINISLYKFSM